LCNLVNLFFLHKAYPNRLIFLDWPINAHCGAAFDELFQTPYSWLQISPRPAIIKEEVWANTSIRERTRWDNVDEWGKHAAIMSVSYHLYSFVPLSYCALVFRTLRPTECVQIAIRTRQTEFGLNRHIVHFRAGDLLILLRNNEGANVEAITAAAHTACTLRPDVLLWAYVENSVARCKDAVIDALADLYFSQSCQLVAYTPYSWFSSWVYLLNRCFDESAKRPVFDFREMHVEVIETA
jgi:hypothetical protein